MHTRVLVFEATHPKGNDTHPDPFYYNAPYSIPASRNTSSVLKSGPPRTVVSQN